MHQCTSLPSVDFGELTVAGGGELQGSGWHVAETSGKVTGIETGDRWRGDAESQVVADQDLRGGVGRVVTMITYRVVDSVGGACVRVTSGGQEGGRGSGQCWLASEGRSRGCGRDAQSLVNSFKTNNYLKSKLLQDEQMQKI